MDNLFIKHQFLPSVVISTPFYFLPAVDIANLHAGKTDHARVRVLTRMRFSFLLNLKIFCLNFPRLTINLPKRVEI